MMSKKTTTDIWQDSDDAPPLTQEWFAKAELREGERVVHRDRPQADFAHHAVSARFDNGTRRIEVRMSSGILFSFDPRDAYGLENATDEQLAEVEVAGAGGSLHFPTLDADFSVPRLLEGHLGPLGWSRRGETDATAGGEESLS